MREIEVGRHTYMTDRRTPENGLQGRREGGIGLVCIDKNLIYILISAALPGRNIGGMVC